MRPVLLYLPGGVELFSYGVMLGLSCVLGGHLAVYLSERSGIPRRQAWAFAVTVIVVGILGGRLHDLLINALPSGRFLDEATAVRHSGRTAYGGFIAAVLAGLACARLLGVSFWRFGDAAAPTMALGLGLTRVGCFLFGCDYGVRSESLGVCFPWGSPAFNDQIASRDLHAAATCSLPVLPAQALSSIKGFSIFALTLWLWFRRPRREGTVLLVFFLAYGLARAAVELVRGDAGRGELLALSTSTTIGLTTAAVAALLLFVPALARLRGDAGAVLVAGTSEPSADRLALGKGLPIGLGLGLALGVVLSLRAASLPETYSPGGAWLVGLGFGLALGTGAGTGLALALGRTPGAWRPGDA